MDKMDIGKLAGTLGVIVLGGLAIIAIVFWVLS